MLYIQTNSIGYMNVYEQNRNSIKILKSSILFINIKILRKQKTKTKLIDKHKNATIKVKLILIIKDNINKNNPTRIECLKYTN